MITDKILVFGISGNFLVILEFFEIKVAASCNPLQNKAFVGEILISLTLKLNTDVPSLWILLGQVWKYQLNPQGIR